MVAVPYFRKEHKTGPFPDGGCRRVFRFKDPFSSGDINDVKAVQYPPLVPVEKILPGMPAFRIAGPLFKGSLAGRYQIKAPLLVPFAGRKILVIILHGLGVKKYKIYVR